MCMELCLCQNLPNMHQFIHNDFVDKTNELPVCTSSKEVNRGWIAELFHRVTLF